MFKRIPQTLLERYGRDRGALLDLIAQLDQAEGQLASVTFLDGFSRFDLKKVTLDGQVLAVARRVDLLRPGKGLDLVVHTRQTYTPGYRFFGRAHGTRYPAIPLTRIVELDLH